MEEPRLESANPALVADVLVVDDRPENLVAFSAALEDPALNVIVARSANEALRALLRHPVDAILLDVAMPDIDGFDAARLIRGRERLQDVPILMITASELELGKLRTGFEAGASDYILKPIDPEVLRKKVNAMVALHRAAVARRLHTELLLEQERQKVRQLHRDNTEADALLRDVAFALRMPLTALKLHVQQALLLTQGQPTVRRHLSSADAQTARLSELLYEVAEVWANRAQSGPPTGPTVDVEEVTREILLALSAKLPQGEAFTVRARAPITGRWNRRVLQSLMRNLVRHSIEIARDAPLIVDLERSAAGIEIITRDRCDEPGPRLHPPHTASAHLSALNVFAALARQAAKLLGGEVQLGDDRRPEVIAWATLPYRVEPDQPPYPMPGPGTEQ